MNDPFAPLSAKPKTEDERRHRRVVEAASAGGKTHRGTKANANRFLFGNAPRREELSSEARDD